MSNYYQTLGIAKSATPDEVKKAYRKLAAQHHPDRGGDEEKLKQINEAYDTLKDPAKRQAYDNPQPQFTQARPGQPNFNIHDIFNMFGQAPGPGNPHSARRSTMQAQLYITLEDVATGGTRLISLSGQENAIEITVPVGINDRDNIRYPRLGLGGSDLVIQFRVRPHTVYQRVNDDLYIDIKVSVWDLILGVDKNIPTILGSAVLLKIPERTQPNAKLKVRGHGLPNKNNNRRGDLIVRVQAEIPESISDSLIEVLRNEKSQ